MKGDNDFMTQHSSNRYGINADSKKWQFTQETIQKSLPAFDDSNNNRRHLTNRDAGNAVRAAATLVKVKHMSAKNPNPKLDLYNLTKVLMDTIAFTVIPGSEGEITLAIYNYDSKIYEFNTNQLSEWITDTDSTVTDKLVKDVMTTILANRRKLVKYWDRPKFMLPVKNGLLDLFNRRLIDYDIELTITARVETNYIMGAKHPHYDDGFTFESLLDNASSGHEGRKQLIMQYMSYCLLGYTYDPKIMNVIGDTGSGKSTMFGLISNIVGKSNIANITYAQVDKDDILIKAAGSWLIFGDDSRGKTFIKSSDFIKIKADNGYFSMSRKYLSAVSVKFDMPMIELMNSHPRIDEAGQQITSRLTWLEMNKSLTKQSKANLNIREVYIKDEALQEHVLSYFVDTFDLFDHFNPIDNSHNEAILAANDILGQFYADLYAQGCMDKCEYLPTSLLYASYLEWVKNTNAGGSKFGKRGFTDASSQILREYGYDLMTDMLRGKTLENESKLDPTTLSFAYSEDKQLVSNTMLDSKPSRCYVRKVKQVPASLIRTETNSIDFIKFFKLTHLFDAWNEPASKTPDQPATQVQAISLRQAQQMIADGTYEDTSLVPPADVIPIKNETPVIEPIASHKDESDDVINVSDVQRADKSSVRLNDEDYLAAAQLSLNIKSVDVTAYDLTYDDSVKMINDLNEFKHELRLLRKVPELEHQRVKLLSETQQSFKSRVEGLLKRFKHDAYILSLMEDAIIGSADASIQAMINFAIYSRDDLSERGSD